MSMDALKLHRVWRHSNSTIGGPPAHPVNIKWENADTLMAPAPAVDKWGTNGFIAKLPPAGVLTGIKILPYERGQRTREGNFSQLRDKFSRSDSLKDKRVDGWGVIAGERQR